MSGFPVQCQRSSDSVIPGTQPKENFVVTAEDFNRVISGIEQTFPIEADLLTASEPHPWQVECNYMALPKSHPKYEEPTEYSIGGKGEKAYAIERDGITKGTFSKGVIGAKIYPGIFFCQDSASVGPSFYTEAWMLSPLAINRIKEEITEGIFDSAPNRSPPDPEFSPAAQYKTFIWEGSRMILRDWLDYSPAIDPSGSSLDTISLRPKPKPIPAPFVALGCKSTESPDASDRKLYSCDIVISVKRPKAEIDFEFRPAALFAGESVLGINSNYNVPPDAGEAKLQPRAEFRPKTSSSFGGGLFGMLQEMASDDGLDEYVVARVYMVGPPGEYALDNLFEGYPFTPLDKIFVRNYWRGNVCYGWRSPPRPLGDDFGKFIPLLSILGTLAGGIGYFAAAGMLSQTSTMSDIVMALLTTKKMEGAVWYV